MEFPIYVLRKIEEHFPEIEYTKELIKLYSHEFEKCDADIDKLTIGTGLEYGLVNMAFKVSLKYRETGNTEDKKMQGNALTNYLQKRIALIQNPTIDFG